MNSITYNSVIEFFIKEWKKINDCETEGTMQVKIEEVQTQEVEPSLQDVEQMAAKQFLLELTKIKNQVYASKTIINSVLIVQLKIMARSLIAKYNSYNLFIGETIDLQLSSYSHNANFRFVYSPKLAEYIKVAATNLNQPKPETTE